MLHLATTVSKPFDENTYLAYLAGRGDCLVFDPGFDPESLIANIEQLGLTPSAILNTHGHVDHIAGNAAFKRRWPACPLVIGRGDAPKLRDPRLNFSAEMGLSVTSPPADELLDEGSRYEAAGFTLEVRKIPGHSRGHIVFIWRGPEKVYVFGGDVLFAGSVGRTDITDGDFEQLASGIDGKLFSLPDDTIVLPGHGPPTTIGEEKENNPYVGRLARWRG